MDIRNAYSELISLLEFEVQDLDLQYESDLDTDLSSLNEELFQRLGQAIRAWTRNVEDQVIFETKAQYEKEMEDFTDQDEIDREEQRAEDFHNRSW